MRSITTFLIAFCTTTAMAQKQGNINGKVLDNNNIPIQSATIALLNSIDSSLVKYEITKASGEYQFEGLGTGNFLIKITATGFSNYLSNSFKYAGVNMNIAAVQMQIAPAELEQVIVTARKPLIEVKADKTVFNVENSIVGQGSDALELLQKTPGVLVDNNENISLKGKTGVRIYIDGRMSQLGGKDLADYLRSLSSNDIEAIEMISNPSAKYDASGNAGIINIKLKKNKKYGTNGSTNIGLRQGITPKGSAAVNLNYRDKKVNIFGNVGGYMGKSRNTLFLNRLQNDSIYDGKSINENLNKSINAKAGVDVFLTKNSTLGVLGTISVSNRERHIESKTPIYNAKTGQLSRTLLALNEIPGNSTNANANLNYRYEDTSGRSLNVDVDYGLFEGVSKSKQPNLYTGPNGAITNSITYGNNTPTTIDIFTAKADMEQNLWKGKFGYGLKTSHVKTDNSFLFYNYENQQPILAKEKSNNFIYNENVYAGYVNYVTQLNAKWSVQGGMRLEHTSSQGLLQRTDEVQQNDNAVNRSYLDFFPSSAITFNASENHSYNLAYSRRIDRPSYQDLNPFENKLDELTYQKGNAFLQPQYTDNIAITHTFKGMLSTSIGYSYVKDYATEVTDTANNSATYIQQRNLASQQILNFNVGAPIAIATWWNGYANAWYNYQVLQGKFNNGTLHEIIPSYGVYMQNTFNVGKKGTTAELTGWYNGPNVWGGTWRTSSMGNVDIGFLQPMFNKKASLKISVTDVFNTNYWTAINNFGGVHINGKGVSENRTLRLNFSYRFGSNEVKASRNRQTGIETEAGRIKG